MRRSARRAAGWLLLLSLGLGVGVSQTADWSAIVTLAKPAVVQICTVISGRLVGVGSGAIISPEGYVLTADHVVEAIVKEGLSLVVVVGDTRQYTASVVTRNTGHDVALLKIGASGLTWLALGDSDKLAYEEEIRVLGYPLPDYGSGYVAVKGTVQGFRSRAGATLIQHDAPTAGGHSGGPSSTRGERSWASTAGSSRTSRGVHSSRSG